MSTLTPEQKDSAVFQKRHWVRLTRVCNNKCLFCLDTMAQNGTVVPEQVVKQKIRDGIAQGAKRLILSGGEPTLHKKFVDFVAFGKEIGYEWVQVVSNGRMFSYPKFVVRAVKNGLDEATISMHGHTPELHDRLVGVKGAFEQSVKGLKNLLALKRVVSVDIVLNRLNLPYLREMLEFFMGLGVYEFDLLHLIPFGRAFDEYFDVLSYDLAFAAPHLQRALELKDTPGLVLWTNRLPIAFLEGAEELVQDPHKLYDEVLGEREVFKTLVKQNVDPHCMGARCPYCPVKGFCDFSRDYVHRYFDHGFETASVSKATIREREGFVKNILKKQGVRQVWVTDDAGAFLYEVRDGKPFGQPMGFRTPDPQQAFGMVAKGKPVTWVVYRDGLKEALKMDISSIGRGLILEFPLFERLSEVAQQAPSLSEFSDLASKLNARVKNLPQCLVPALEVVNDPPVLDVDLVTEQGIIDLASLVKRFIIRGNFVKSNRCATCGNNQSCQGLQINLARHFGLGVLKPIRTLDV